MKDVVKLLLHFHGIDPNIPGWFFRTPLHCAAEKGHLEIVRLLAGECNADVHVFDDLNCTPLHLACKEGHINIVRLLIQSYQANPSERDEVL